jgi:hypothetical protein
MILIMLFTTAIASQEPARIETTHDNIRYWESSMQDPVAGLQRELENGTVSLSHDPVFGYLPTLLERFNIPLESQILVFSKTSLQSAHISPESPRAIYFNDDVAVAWVRRGPLLEIGAHDPQNGVVFYTINQAQRSTPEFAREQVCLDCHHTTSTLGIPGMLVRTTFPGLTGLAVAGLGGGTADHRTPFEERWGGWYVTGKRAPVRHRGNAVVMSVTGEGPLMISREPSAPLRESLTTSSYLTPYSDIVALAVFEHQVHMTNLINRAAWESRAGAVDQSTIQELIDYMLFVEEAPLSSPMEGSSGFTEFFAARGPADSLGRSLRVFDLNTRLFRYPCSYMIYSAAFQSLPPTVKGQIYRRLTQILSGKENNPRYRRLGEIDRKAIMEILRDTLPGFPM